MLPDDAKVVLFPCKAPELDLTTWEGISIQALHKAKTVPEAKLGPGLKGTFHWLMLSHQ